MIIRAAKLEDIPAMIEIGRHFFDATEYSQFSRYCPDTLSGFFASLIDGDEHVILVVEFEEGGAGTLVGLAISMVFPAWFDRDTKMAQELVWWIEPPHRKKEIGLALLDALEVAVCEKGARSFIVASLDNLEPERLAQLYKRRGYVALEHTFLKGLGEPICHPVSQQS